jgi:UDP:flavonoid glycosyltransferase YjiC (YdhE family)
MGRDQHDVSRRVVAVGAGLEVDLNNVGHELLPAVRHVLNEPRVAHAAADIARSIAELGGLEEALAIIDRSTPERVPWQTA